MIAGPLFGYIGGKWKLAPMYPAPTEDVLIEPFAGSAGYSLRYPNRKVMLYDADPELCSVWHYLIHAAASEILSLPNDPDRVGSYPPEVRKLVSLWVDRKSGGTPGRWGESAKERIASAQPSIRHWQVKCCDYQNVPIERATWYVDPPYQHPGSKCYKYQPGSFGDLAVWCLTVPGQLIVCEQEGANWLPFTPIATVYRRNPARFRPSVRSQLEDEINTMVEAGFTHREVSGILEVSKGTVLNVVKKTPFSHGPKQAKTYREVVYLSNS